MNSSKNWLKLTLSCPEKMAEAVSDLMVVLSGSGVDIHPVEGTDINNITGFFSLEEKTAAEIRHNTASEFAALFTLYNQEAPKMTSEVIADQDWATSWQQFFKPVEIIPGLVIKPSWEEYIPTDRQHVIQMDPGMAFGTGQHESTQMALLLISTTLSQSSGNIKKILDVGTGTGILAMAAALLGGSGVLAIDNDPEAVSVAQGNVKKNNLDSKISVSGTPVTDIQDTYDLICANIVHDVLIAMTADISRLIAPGGRVVLSGILSGAQEKNIVQVYGASGMRLIRTEHDKEWAALLLEADSRRI